MLGKREVRDFRRVLFLGTFLMWYLWFLSVRVVGEKRMGEGFDGSFL